MLLFFFFYSRPPRHLQSCSKKHSRGSWDILDFFQAYEVTVIFPPTLIFLWAGWLLLLSTPVAAMAAVFRYELAHICVDSVLLIYPYVSCINNSRHSFTLIKFAHLLMVCPCPFVAKTYTWWLLGGSAKGPWLPPFLGDILFLSSRKHLGLERVHLTLSSKTRSKEE